MRAHAAVAHVVRAGLAVTGAERAVGHGRMRTGATDAIIIPAFVAVVVATAPIR
jgi:hypothetical protein